jgi:3',5'-cyclic AMP phosphodiesterase CpdA
MIRLAHLSDIHITSPQVEWALRDWFNKRCAAWINFRWLGRGKRFRHADEVLRHLLADWQERRPEHIVFSGDATALGFEAELRRATELLHIGNAHVTAGLAVPGNHDYCTPPAAASGLFERYFAGWQTGVRIDDDTYPFAQRVGHITLIGVNSCTGNFWPWDASGTVGPAQLSRLRLLLQRLEAGPRILITHYPLCVASGKPENPAHGLRDLQDLVRVAVEGGVSLWLHGHRHRMYHFQQPPVAPFPVICAGSATQTRLWSYGDYTIEGWTCHVQQRVFDAPSKKFRDGQTFTLQLRQR